MRVNANGRLSPLVERLKDAIEIDHGCRAEHVDSELVVESIGVGDRLEEVVEVFELVGCARARRCFAWLRKTGFASYPVIILESPPVPSAHAAVRTFLARQSE